MLWTGVPASVLNPGSFNVSLKSDQGPHCEHQPPPSGSCLFQTLSFASPTKCEFLFLTLESLLASGLGANPSFIWRNSGLLESHSCGSLMEWSLRNKQKRCIKKPTKGWSRWLCFSGDFLPSYSIME
jgi:hypothetical protein